MAEYAERQRDREEIAEHHALAETMADLAM